MKSKQNQNESNFKNKIQPIIISNRSHRDNSERQNSTHQNKNSFEINSQKMKIIRFGRILKNKGIWNVAQSNIEQLGTDRIFQNSNQISRIQESFNLPIRKEQQNKTNSHNNTSIIESQLPISLKCRQIMTRINKRMIQNKQKQPNQNREHKNFEIKKNISKQSSITPLYSKLPLDILPKDNNIHFTNIYKKDHNLQIKSIARQKISSKPPKSTKNQIMICQIPTEQNYETKQQNNNIILKKQKNNINSNLSTYHRLKQQNISPKSILSTHVYKFQIDKNIHPNNYNIIQSNQSNYQLEKKQISKPIINIIQIPKIPNPPTINTTEQEIFIIVTELAQKFNLQYNPKQINKIDLKKFKNCIILLLPKNKIIWHYSGKLYIGDRYEDYIDDKNGQGIRIIPGQYYYKGQFLNGKKNGTGLQMQFNGNFYQGQWINGYRSGHGKSIDSSQIIYDGQWNHNKKQGYGLLWVSIQQYYKGTFLNDVKHGYGFEQFMNGDRYQGQYMNGKFDGQGKYFWFNGSYFIGKFSNGYRNGNGRWKSAIIKIIKQQKTSEQKLAYDMYLGGYKNDKKQGYGRYVWSNGAVYEGNFKNDMKHGEGRVQYPDMRQVKAVWKNGQLNELVSQITSNGQYHAEEQDNTIRFKMNNSNEDKYIQE